MTKKLNMTSINKLNKEFELRDEFTFKGYSFSIDRNLKTTKMSDLLSKYRSLIKEEIELDIEQKAEYKPAIVFVLIIKTFTDIEIPDEVSYQQCISLFDKFIDIGLFEFFIEQFGQERMDWVTEKINLSSKAVLDKLELLEKNNPQFND